MQSVLYRGDRPPWGLFTSLKLSRGSWTRDGSLRLLGNASRRGHLVFSAPNAPGLRARFVNAEMCTFPIPFCPCSDITEGLRLKADKTLGPILVPRRGHRAMSRQKRAAGLAGASCWTPPGHLNNTAANLCRQHFVPFWELGGGKKKRRKQACAWCRHRRHRRARGAPLPARRGDRPPGACCSVSEQSPPWNNPSRGAQKLLVWPERLCLPLGVVTGLLE